MPISTIPNTPAHHDVGTETLLNSPRARARNRWFEERSPPAPAIVNMKESEEAPLIIPSINNHENKAQSTWWKRWIVLISITALLFVAFVVMTNETEMVTELINSVATRKDEIPPEAEKQWLFVTGTSPHALEKACVKHSAHRIHDERIVGVETAESVTFALMTRYTRGQSCIVCGPPPKSLSEFDNINFRVIVYVEDGFNASFDPRFMIWARARGFETNIEDAIDESCLERRIRTRRKYSCTIKEIGILRAATIWRLLTDEATERQSNRFEMIQLIDNDNEEPKQRIMDMAHEPLVYQLYTSHLRMPVPPLLLESIPGKPPEPVIDAGYCKIVRENTDYDYKGAKAICLPTFIIIGAQKSATDEITVWLNKNKFNRRMDGGVEIHFFDCLGRGRGEDRFSCERRRSYVMQDHQREVRDTLLPNETEGARPWHFSWVIEREKSPFLDDRLWTSYLRLGHLNHRDYYKDPGRTLVFEKSPSYLDMADPRDVVRLLPRVKMVLVTREPVARLLSAYYQFCDNPEKDDGPCTTEEFNRYALEFCEGKLDLDTPGPHLTRRRAFARAARHGEYADLLEKWIRYFWVDDETMADKQFLVVDHHHFRFVPLAVMYVIESFSGNRGGIRHFKYEPRFTKNGYYTLGDYTKANHPSHQEDMSPEVQKALERYYHPSMMKLREILLRKNGPALFGCVHGERFSLDQTSPHPDLFDGDTRFALPPWMKLPEEKPPR